MKNQAHLLLMVIFAVPLLLLAPQVQAKEMTSFFFPDFSDLSPLHLNGVAKEIAKAQDRETNLRLTNARNQTGNVFYKKRIGLDQQNTFSTYFQFRIHSPVGAVDKQDQIQGADGIVFTVQTQSVIVGKRGVGIGYEKIIPSIGIEFDTWFNSNKDPDGNHIGINVNGNSASVVTASPPDKRHLNDGEIWHAWVDYDAKNLSVRLSSTSSRPTEALLTKEIDLRKTLKDRLVYVGFTSGTGMSGNSHDILQWAFSSTYNPIEPEKQNEYGAISVSLEKQEQGENVIVILDASGSMHAKMDDTTKMEIAKKVTMGFADVIDENTRFGLRVYGHRVHKSKKQESCRDSQLLIPLQQNSNRKKIKQQLEALDAKGYTPIGYSLSQIQKDFVNHNGTKRVILITDGIESCDQHSTDPYYPVKVIEQLRIAGIDVKVNVVGFDIQDKKTRGLLSKIAKAGKGKYFSAASGEQLEGAIHDSLGDAFYVKNVAGQTVGKGTIGLKNVFVPVGSYGVEFETNPPLRIDHISVKKGQTTHLKLTQTTEGIKVSKQEKNKPSQQIAPSLPQERPKAKATLIQSFTTTVTNVPRYPQDSLAERLRQAALPDLQQQARKKGYSYSKKGQQFSNLTCTTEKTAICSADVTVDFIQDISP